MRGSCIKIRYRYKQVRIRIRSYRTQVSSSSLVSSQFYPQFLVKVLVARVEFPVISYHMRSTRFHLNVDL